MYIILMIWPSLGLLKYGLCLIDICSIKADIFDFYML